MAFMAAAAPYMQYAGMAMSAVNAYQNSQGAKTAYGMQSQVAQNNAQIANWQADDALARGNRDAIRMRIKTNQVKGSQRAALAANGVDLGQGSALNILTDTDYFGDVDADTIQGNAAKEAWALRNQAGNFTSESKLLRSRAERENPLFAGGASLLTSAGKVAGNWYTPSAGSKVVPDYPGAEY
jgi:hypothetical protein